MGYEVEKTDEEWRALLDDEQYRVTRRAGTEAPFTGEYTDHEEEGVYSCVCCGAELFRSSAKYHSGCGWPSFVAPSEVEAVEEREDLSHGMRRVEVVCRRCGAHLGHVFPDGPKPSGMRYCINSVSLTFEGGDDESTGGGG